MNTRLINGLTPKEYRRAQYLKHRQAELAKMAEWRARNPNYIPKKQNKSKRSKRSKPSKEYARQCQKLWIQRRKADGTYSIIRAKQRARLAQDPKYRFGVAVRGRIGKAIKLTLGEKKRSRTVSMLGCSIEFLKKHIELQFNNGMSWDNYGPKGWHVDHIIPLSRATSIEEIEKLCHYTNLQPLWWYDNLSKSDS